METYKDYLMLISPPKNIMYDIDCYKRAAARVIGEFPGMHSPAHITVNKQHRCKPFISRHGIGQMRDKLDLLTPQKLQINNFKFFNHGQTGLLFMHVLLLTIIPGAGLRR